MQNLPQSLGRGAVIAVRPDPAAEQYGGLAATDPGHEDAVAFQVTGPIQLLRHAPGPAVPGRRRAGTVRLCRLTGVVSGRPAAVSIPPGLTIWCASSLCDWPAALTPTGATA